jgi:hypothetical protein
MNRFHHQITDILERFRSAATVMKVKLVVMQQVSGREAAWIKIIF